CRWQLGQGGQEDVGGRVGAARVHVDHHVAQAVSWYDDVAHRDRHDRSAHGDTVAAEIAVGGTFVGDLDQVLPAGDVVLQFGEPEISHRHTRTHDHASRHVGPVVLAEIQHGARQAALP